MTCWIPSEAGKKFEIRGEISEPQRRGIKSVAFVDGHECPPWVVHPPWTGTLEFDCLSNQKVKTAVMFKDIDFTDDDSALDNDSGDIGQIVMKLQRGKFTKVRKARSARSESPSSDTLCAPEDKVHERLKKGRRHRVGFGEEQPDQEEQTTYRDDFDDEPATVFIFNYTSLDSLWAMNVAPRTSSQTLADDTARIREIEFELQRLRAKEANSSLSRDQKPLAIKLEPVV